MDLFTLTPVHLPEKIQLFTLKQIFREDHKASVKICRDIKMLKIIF